VGLGVTIPFGLHLWCHARDGVSAVPVEGRLYRSGKECAEAHALHLRAGEAFRDASTGEGGASTTGDLPKLPRSSQMRKPCRQSRRLSSSWPHGVQAVREEATS
jgi:hypothetical protein